jgi:hypothetical protein
MDEARAHEAKSLPDLRGMGPEESPRGMDDDPFSARSYCAQYGVPLADAFRLLSAENIGTHGDMLRAIRIEYLSDPDFLKASIALQTHPERSRDPREGDSTPEIVGPLTDPGFTRPLKILTTDNLEYQREFFEVSDEQYTDEELDGFAQMLERFPGSGWIKGHSTTTRRVYALSCISLMNEDPDSFDSAIVHGDVWNSYG